MSRSNIKITRVSKTRLRVESLRNLRGKSYALERFLSKSKRRKCSVQRTGYGGRAFIDCPASMIKGWDSMGLKVGSTIEGKA